MKIEDIRRSNLRDWVSAHGTPTKERSYFSQLLAVDSSFGEKAARRLEETYKMGEGFLDRTNVEAEAELQKIPENYVDADDFIRLIDLFRKSTRDGRAFILNSAEVADKIVVGRSRKTAKDQA